MLQTRMFTQTATPTSTVRKGIFGASVQSQETIRSAKKNEQTRCIHLRDTKKRSVSADLFFISVTFLSEAADILKMQGRRESR